MVDRTLPLLADGYLYLTRVRQAAGHDTVPLRLLGRRATTLVGPEATKLFYDGATFDRQGIVPANVQHTLFGDSAVHLLDGAAHQVRKSLFVDVLDREGTEALAGSVSQSFDRAVASWSGRDVVLFDEAAELLAGAVHDWAGVPLDSTETRRTGQDMVAMVDGFASLGARGARAVWARKRQERRLEELVSRARRAGEEVRPGSALAAVLAHRDHDDEPLDEHTAAVELLNLLRPTVALTWFLTYTAHALHHWPRERDLLLSGGPERALAFAHEVRRFYPFAPLLAARARRDVLFDGVTIPAGTLGVLDVFGQHHDSGLWEDPWRFSSDRFTERPPGMYDLVPQGGGDPTSGHRCPGEPATIRILADLAPRIAALDVVVPDQDLRVTRRRVPARVRSGLRMSFPQP